MIRKLPTNLTRTILVNIMWHYKIFFSPFWLIDLLDKRAYPVHDTYTYAGSGEGLMYASDELQDNGTSYLGEP